MERYLEIITLEELATVDRSCELLTNAGIPVILKHIEIIDGNESRPGYSLLVPTQHSHAAQSVIGIAPIYRH